jgi:hypothetical protein
MPRKSPPQPKPLSPTNLLELLADRFEKNPDRHKKLKWQAIESRLHLNPKHLEVLQQMEVTEGEPDVIHYDRKSDQFLFMDCSPESPKGRRSLCFDRAALNSRKEHKPTNSALDLADSIGCEILTEQEYRLLQEVGEFDLKSSSWVQTPADIRALGGALFCDRRFGHVFVYHNGAQSYYADRGFRRIVRV